MRLSIYTWIVGASLLMLNACDSPQQVGDFHVIPAPQEVTEVAGAAPFVLHSGTPICYPAGNEKLARTAHFLASYIREVTGAHGMVYMADQTLAEADCTTADALILPGGMPGATNLNACEPLRERLKAHYAQEKLVAAICAAPLVLGGLGFLQGRKATCYPGFEDQLTGTSVTGEAVEIDGPVITGRGPGLVFNFGLALVAYLQGLEKADEVAEGMLL